MAPVTVAESLWLPPGTAERDSDAALDVTDPPGCVAIEVSDEFAALFCDWKISNATDKQKIVIAKK